MFKPPEAWRHVFACVCVWGRSIAVPEAVAGGRREKCETPTCYSPREREKCETPTYYGLHVRAGKGSGEAGRVRRFWRFWRVRVHWV